MLNKLFRRSDRQDHVVWTAGGILAILVLTGVIIWLAWFLLFLIFAPW